MRANRLLPLLAISLLSCYSKDAGFFPTVNSIVDEDGPVFQGYLPPLNVPALYNTNTFSFEVVDLPGNNGAPPSGVDVNSIEVLRGPGALPTTRNGNSYAVDLTGVADGPVVLNLGAKDLYGNASSGIVNFTLKRTPPVVNLTSAPPQAWQSNRSMETLSYGGTIMDPYLSLAVGSLYRAGDDGQCRDDNSLLWPVGDGAPGTVNQNVFDYGLSGQFQIDVNAWNGVLAGGSPKIGRYCLGITASDQAIPPNKVTVFHRSELQWLPPAGVTSVLVTPDNITLTHPTTQQMTATVSADPGVPLGVTWSAGPLSVGTVDQNGVVTTVGPGPLDVQACSVHSPTVCGTARMSVQDAPFDFNVSWALVSWNHVAFNGGLSNTCGRGKATVTQGTQSLAGAPYTVMWTGPGVIGTTTRSGTLDANGEFFDRQAIVLFGTYNATVSVTVGGETRNATGSTSVNAGAGTCPPP